MISLKESFIIHQLPPPRLLLPFYIRPIIIVLNYIHADSQRAMIPH